MLNAIDICEDYKVKYNKMESIILPDGTTLSKVYCIVPHTRTKTLNFSVDAPRIEYNFEYGVCYEFRNMQVIFTDDQRNAFPVSPIFLEKNFVDENMWKALNREQQIKSVIDG